VAYYIKDKPQYRVAARIPTGERYSFMFTKNFADIAKVNDALTAMKKDGTIAKVHVKWFGIPPPADSATVKVLDMPK
jgi:polar amino acid transport system substrate-binding protein